MLFYVDSQGRSLLEQKPGVHEETSHSENFLGMKISGREHSRFFINSALESYFNTTYFIFWLFMVSYTEGFDVIEVKLVNLFLFMTSEFYD